MSKDKQRSSPPRARKGEPILGPLFVSLYDGSIPTEINETTLEELRRMLMAWTTYLNRLSSSPSTDAETAFLVARALLRRGVAYTLLEEWHPALSDLSRVIAMQIGDAETNTASLYRARVQDALGQDEAAISDWSFVLERMERASTHPERFPKQLAALGYAYRARLYARLGNYQQAIADCERALAFDASYAEAYSVRGSAYAYLGKETQALADCSRAIELEKEPLHFYRRGRVYKHIGNYDQALADFQQAHQGDPTNERFQKEYAELLMLHLIRVGVAPVREQERATALLPPGEAE